METRTEADEFKAHLQGRLKSGRHIVSSTLENSGSEVIKLIMEPYGTPILVPPSSSCEIVAEEPVGLGIHMEFLDSDIQVWSNGIVEVFQEGVGYGVTGYYLDWLDGRKNLQDQGQ